MKTVEFPEYAWVLSGSDDGDDHWGPYVFKKQLTNIEFNQWQAEFFKRHGNEHTKSWPISWEWTLTKVQDGE